MNASAIVTLGGVQVLVLGGCALLAIILVKVMVFVALAAWARARPRLRAWRRSWRRSTPLSGQIVSAWLRGLVIMHGLIALFLGVIALAIILLVVGPGAFWVLVIMSRAIMVLVVPMTNNSLVIVAIALAALTIVQIVTTVTLMVAWCTATCGGKMSRFFSPLAASYPWQSYQ